MVITLPEPLLKQASQIARQRGVEVDALVVEAVEQYLAERWQSAGDDVSEARRRLRALSRYKIRTGGDFMEDVHRAKARAYELYNDNEEWIEQMAARIAERRQKYGLETDIG